jgi:hypothetical protein
MIASRSSISSISTTAVILSASTAIRRNTSPSNAKSKKADMTGGKGKGGYGNTATDHDEVFAMMAFDLPDAKEQKVDFTVKDQEAVMALMEIGNGDIDIDSSSEDEKKMPNLKIIRSMTYHQLKMWKQNYMRNEAEFYSRTMFKGRQQFIEYKDDEVGLVVIGEVENKSFKGVSYGFKKLKSIDGPFFWKTRR